LTKRLMLVFAILLVVTLGWPASQAQNQTSQLPTGRLNNNPKPFDKFAAPVSAPIAFLFSSRGQAMLQASPHPLAPSLLKVGGVESTGTLPTAPSPGVLPAPRQNQSGVPTGVVPRFPGTTTCGSATGNLFNLEPFLGTPPAPATVPQNEETVDAIVGGGVSGADLVVGGANDYRGFFGALGSSITGYYVQRSGTCAPTFEGGAPTLPDPLHAGAILFGGGDPVVRADAARGAVFEADLRFNFVSGGTTAITVQRTTVANLNNTVNCPGGTQNTGAAARTCWPTGVVVNPLPLTFAAFFNDKPHMTVDGRPFGIGAGNVYVTWTEFDFFTSFSRILMAVCTNSLSACSAATVISDNDLATQFSHVSVRPDGGVTVTYENFGFFPSVQIKYVSCTPAAAPSTPSCAPPTLVTTETQPLIFAGSQDFRVATYAKHDHRTNGATTETFVAWERCHVFFFPFLFGCPKSEIRMTESNNGGVSWSAPTTVDASLGDQFFVWISAERTSGTVNIAYYSAEGDSFSHKIQTKLAQINPGGVFPEPITGRVLVTSVLDDPAADPFLGDFFFGDYIGVVGVNNATNTARRAYIHFTGNEFFGSYGGVGHAEQNNQLSRFDY